MKQTFLLLRKKIQTLYVYKNISTKNNKKPQTNKQKPNRTPPPPKKNPITHNKIQKNISTPL